MWPKTSREIFGQRNKKNIAGQVLTYNSKNFHCLHKLLDLERFGSNKKIWFKQKNKRIMNYEMEKPFRKKSIQKLEKTVKIDLKLPHVNKKTTSEKANFCWNTVFSLYFKIIAKISRCKTTRFLAPFLVSTWPKSLLQLDFKNHENVWTDLTKKTAPRYNLNSLNCKKQQSANNSLSYRLPAIKKLCFIFSNEWWIWLLNNRVIMLNKFFE